MMAHPLPLIVSSPNALSPSQTGGVTGAPSSGKEELSDDDGE